MSAEEHREEPVSIVSYDPAWPAKFEAERDLILATIGPFVSGGIEHVGSTAVPGLAAKPIIDIMVGVRSLADARGCFELLEEVGYLYFPYRPEWFHWFCKPSPARRTHHLVLMSPQHPQWVARLAFRDYLRTHPEAASEYASLKRRLATEHHTDREAYTDGKQEFVETIVALAAAETGE